MFIKGDSLFHSGSGLFQDMGQVNFAETRGRQVRVLTHGLDQVLQAHDFEAGLLEVVEVHGEAIGGGTGARRRIGADMVVLQYDGRRGGRCVFLQLLLLRAAGMVCAVNG